MLTRITPVAALEKFPDAVRDIYQQDCDMFPAPYPPIEQWAKSSDAAALRFYSDNGKWLAVFSGHTTKPTKLYYLKPLREWMWWKSLTTEQKEEVKAKCKR